MKGGKAKGVKGKGNEKGKEGGEGEGEGSY